MKGTSKAPLSWYHIDGSWCDKSKRPHLANFYMFCRVCLTNVCPGSCYAHHKKSRSIVVTVKRL